jgi:uncharacterized ferritin-like protein (DUF455 family)
MQTSQAWWAAVKADPAKLETWLRKQYHGEVTASYRIADMAMESTPEQRTTLMAIADQEMTHASMVLTLLAARGLDVGQHDAEARYWSQVKSAAIGFEDKAAVATLAEGMRLERIRVIAADLDAPADIRQVFATILEDEEWHEIAFKDMTTSSAIEKLRPYHNLGREVLGLEH